MDYKEKLRLAKYALESGSYDKDTIEYIFPELRESEGEKIREKLIDTFNFYDPAMNSPFLLGIHRKDIIAWLEKQGNTFTKKDIDDAYLKGICDAKHEFEKQGEQKTYGQRKECLDCQFNYSGECKGSCAMKRSEQKPQRMISAEAKEALYDKPAWSEEDMKEALRTEYEKGKADAIAEMKLSWSEDDEKMLDAIIDFFENGTVKLQHDLLLYASWLKSLRPQKQWKPSDEQMRALHDINLTGNISYTGQGQTLIELYNDLKKL